jgi:hypothetical protein
MHPTPKPARTLPRCKIKAVNPPFRSVSTPRSTKDLHKPGPVNPGASLESTSGSAAVSEWGAQHLCERLRMELAPGAWKRLVGAAKRRGGTLEQLLASTLSEVA